MQYASGSWLDSSPGTGTWKNKKKGPTRGWCGRDCRAAQTFAGLFDCRQSSRDPVLSSLCKMRLIRDEGSKPLGADYLSSSSVHVYIPAFYSYTLRAERSASSTHNVSRCAYIMPLLRLSHLHHAACLRSTLPRQPIIRKARF